MTKLSDKELLEELRNRFVGNKNSLKELKKLNEELITVNKKLEESEALKSHFISNITNEIINPFTSILALSKNILSVKKEDWKRVISMVALIHSEAFNLDFQFKNIFVAAKIEAGEIFPEIMSVDIKSLVDSVIDNFKVESKKKKLKIEHNFNIKDLEKASSFKTDPEKLKLMLSNMLSNAVKFSYDNQEINVDSSLKDGKLLITVQDFGTGISDENQKIIFDRFKRLDSGINSINRGHGLGLSVNKALLDLLGGTINVVSKPEKGATFSINIPELEADISGFSSDGNEFMFDDVDGGDSF